MTSIDGFDDAADDFAEFAENLREFAARTDEAVDDGVEDTALQIEGTAKEHAPVETGNLRSSISHRRIDIAEFIVGTPVEYAPDVEFGTQPHPITPNGDDPLTFKVDDEWVSTYHVDHPGTPAQPFLRKALRQHQSDLSRNIQQSINALVREIF